MTDKMLEQMADWRCQPRDRIYQVVFIDAIVVKVRDGQVTNRLSAGDEDPSGPKRG